MGGVWMFDEVGVVTLGQNPLAVPLTETNMAVVQRKVLVHLPSNAAMTSFEILYVKLCEAGWTRYWDGDHTLRQYHLSDCCADLISLPMSFAYMKSTHMYDIAVKNPLIFRVRDTN